MKTLQTIAIIGATEKNGSAIAARLAKRNYHLVLVGNETDELQHLGEKLARENGPSIIDLVTCAKEASWEADIIILATSYEPDNAVAEKIREVATGKIVISISGPLNSRHDELTASLDTSAAEELQKLLPHSKVVKALVTNFTAPIIDGKAPSGFIAGNNGDAVTTVIALFRAAGLNPAVAGDLSASRTLEQMHLLLIQPGITSKYDRKVLHN